jgi:hypothetical protein
MTSSIQRPSSRESASCATAIEACPGVPIGAPRRPSGSRGETGWVAMCRYAPHRRRRESRSPSALLRNHPAAHHLTQALRTGQRAWGRRDAELSAVRRSSSSRFHSRRSPDDRERGPVPRRRPRVPLSTRPVSRLVLAHGSWKHATRHSDVAALRFARSRRTRLHLVSRLFDVLPWVRAACAASM